MEINEILPLFLGIGEFESNFGYQISRELFMISSQLAGNQDVTMFQFVYSSSAI